MHISEAPLAQTLVRITDGCAKRLNKTHHLKGRQEFHEGDYARIYVRRTQGTEVVGYDIMFTERHIGIRFQVKINEVYDPSNTASKMEMPVLRRE